MRIQLVPREQTAKAWAEWEHDLARSVSAAARPAVVMADESAALLDHRERVFRGRRYRVPPIPWRLAVQVLTCQEDLRQNARAGAEAGTPAEIAEDTLAIFERASDLAKKIMRPTSFVRRLLWPLTPNPFRRATPKEVGELLGFFFVCLVVEGGQQSPPAPRGTSPQIGRPSPGASRPGPARTATRSPGVIS